MTENSPSQGISTLVLHYNEGLDPNHAHVTPIYQTATFSYPDTATGAAIYKGEKPGYSYTRGTNPNPIHYASKIAMLESLDLRRTNPDKQFEEVAAGKTFSSGMAAISAAILGRAKVGDTLIVQQSIYSNSFNFFSEIAPRLGLNAIWLRDTTPAGWQGAFRAHPEAILAYAETPANPTMLVVDLAAIAEIAHQHGSWLMVDNTFATPYCQRPITLGADVVLHSTTKYLSGHGVIIGGVVVSPHLDFVQEQLALMMKTLGAAPSPFDSWLANMGLKTFELRMQRHCDNAMAVARYLESHPKVAAVYYPGLDNHQGHDIAQKQMLHYGGMLSFELDGGIEAGETLMNNLHVATLVVSLGNVDSLIQHPASMTHSTVPPTERIKMGISDGLVRFSVGVENIEDILEDLDHGLKQV